MTDSKTFPHIEMNWSRNDGTSARLPSTELSRYEPVLPQQQKNSKIWDFFRHIRLLMPGVFIGSVFSWRSSTEDRKVAAYQNRSMAVLNSLLHLIPLSGALALIVLHWTKYWVGGSTNNAIALQFLAKLHELLMKASLVDLLLYIIRAQALEGFIPLGALSGAAQSPRLSYLWSLDFISAISAPNFSAFRKIIFSFSAFVLLFMAATVGPSSAVLMISQPEMPKLNNTVLRYLNVSENSLFPTRMDKTSGLNFSRLNELKDAVFLGSTVTPDQYTTYSYAWQSDELHGAYINGFMRIVFSSAQFLIDSAKYDPYEKFHTTTIPTQLSSLQLSYYSPRVSVYEPGHVFNANWTTRTSQPVIRTICTNEFVNPEDIYYYNMGGSRNALPNATGFWEQLLKPLEDSNGDVPFYNPAVWITAPEEPSSLLGLWSQRLKSSNGENYNSIQVCTVSPFWRTAQTTLTVANTGILIQTDIPTSMESLANDALKSITIDPEGIPGLARPCLIEGLSDNLVNPINLGACFAAAISWIPGRDQIHDKNIDKDNHLVRGYDRLELVNSAPMIAYRIDTTIYGFGYGSNNMSTSLSLSVITAYAIIISIYVGYTIATGHTSIAWGSATELMMLALQSRVPDHLGHISVGIDSAETFQQSVGIRVKTVDIGDTGETIEKLELVFEHDQNAKGSESNPVERNKAY